MGEALLGTLFPARCVFCGAVVPRGQATCPACAAAAARVEGPLCPRCGRGRAFCRCRGRRFAFFAVAAPFYYEGVVRQGVARFKFHGRRAAAAGFAGLSLPAIHSVFADAPVFDAVTSVPLSRAGLARRGYNQSALFARALAGRLGLPYAELLAKPVDVRPQHTCDAEERWGNVFGAFVPKGEVRGRLLLADDILTTGATLHECARMLRLAGASDVGCAVIACVR